MTKEHLSALTVVELKAMAKENGLKGYSKLRKADLVELLAVDVVEVEEVSATGLLNELKADNVLLLEEKEKYTEFGVKVKKYKVSSDYVHTLVFAKNGITGKYDKPIYGYDEVGNRIDLLNSFYDIIIHGMSHKDLSDFAYLSKEKDIASIQNSLKNHLLSSWHYAKKLQEVRNLHDPFLEELLQME